MAEDTTDTRRSRFWITVIAVIILLIFLYFYKPFEGYLAEAIPNIHFSNVIFWFASLVGVIGYAIAHWQSFRTNILRSVNELEVDGLVYDTLQVSILIAIIFCAGGTIQAIEMLAEHLMNRGQIFEAAFGEKLLAIILLVILAVLFYLLHHAVRGFRVGWQTRRPPIASSYSSDRSS
jgi:hypothetical protein